MSTEDLTQLLREGILKPELICPVVYTMSVIGQKWRIPTLWHLADEGTLRYNELNRGVVGITNITSWFVMLLLSPSISSSRESLS